MSLSLKTDLAVDVIIINMLFVIFCLSVSFYDLFSLCTVLRPWLVKISSCTLGLFNGLL